MIKYIALVVVIFTNASMAFTQYPALEKWDSEVIDMANTARETDYFTEQEKNILLLMNLARLDGDRFASTFLTDYIQSKGGEKNEYVNSLYRDLKKVKGLPPLHPAKDLSEIANGHATKSGKSGHVGHKDMEKRFKPVFGHPYYYIAENCSYGYDDAINIVLTLLIDKGIKSLGHRKNILNSNFNFAGVAIQPHSKHQHNCVIDFGGTSYQ